MKLKETLLGLSLAVGEVFKFANGAKERYSFKKIKLLVRALRSAKKMSHWIEEYTNSITERDQEKALMKIRYYNAQFVEREDDLTS